MAMGKLKQHSQNISCCGLQIKNHYHPTTHYIIFHSQCRGGYCPPETCDLVVILCVNICNMQKAGLCHMKCSCIMALTCCSRVLPTGNFLTIWGHVTYSCLCTLTIICSYSGLSGRRQTIIWTIAGIFLIGTLGTEFSEIISEIHSW